LLDEGHPSAPNNAVSRKATERREARLPEKAEAKLRDVVDAMGSFLLPSDCHRHGIRLIDESDCVDTDCAIEDGIARVLCQDGKRDRFSGESLRQFEDDFLP